VTRSLTLPSFATLRQYKTEKTGSLKLLYSQLILFSKTQWGLCSYNFATRCGTKSTIETIGNLLQKCSHGPPTYFERKTIIWKNWPAKCTHWMEKVANIDKTLCPKIYVKVLFEGPVILMCL
jgi:hypothetical protein